MADSLVPGIHFEDGICLPGFIPASHVTQVRNLNLDSSDVMVTGYPRSGSTWTAATIEAILNADQLDDFKWGSLLYIDFPYLLMDVKQHKSPRAMISHLRYHMLPEDVHQKKMKIVHISRDPRDIAVSYFYLHRIYRPINYEGSWDTFFKAFIDGKILFGSWFDYTKDWMSHKKDPNILYIKYEYFLDDMPETIRKLAGFLGKRITYTAVDQIASMVSFKSMQNNPVLTNEEDGTGSTMDDSKGNFIRLGKIGDWKNYFTNEQEKAFDSVYRELDFAEDK